MAPEPDTSTHFWFMTVQTPTVNGFYLDSHYGTVTPAPGRTRWDLFNALREQIATDAPRSRHGNVIAFDIQPNQL